MRYYESPFGRVALTAERLEHILLFHPDVSPCLRYVAETLARPERTASSVHDKNVVIYYHYLPRRKRFLAVVVKIENHPFILTMYLAKKPKRDTL